MGRGARRPAFGSPRAQPRDPRVRRPAEPRGRFRSARRRTGALAFAPLGGARPGPTERWPSPSPRARVSEAYDRDADADEGAERALLERDRGAAVHGGRPRGVGDDRPSRGAREGASFGTLGFFRSRTGARRLRVSSSLDEKRRRSTRDEAPRRRRRSLGTRCGASRRGRTRGTRARSRSGAGGGGRGDAEARRVGPRRGRAGGGAEGGDAEVRARVRARPPPFMASEGRTRPTRTRTIRTRTTEPNPNDPNSTRRLVLRLRVLRLRVLLLRVLLRFASFVALLGHASARRARTLTLRPPRTLRRRASRFGRRRGSAATSARRRGARGVARKSGRGGRGAPRRRVRDRAASRERAAGRPSRRPSPRRRRRGIPRRSFESFEPPARRRLAGRRSRRRRGSDGGAPRGLFGGASSGAPRARDPSERLRAPGARAGRELRRRRERLSSAYAFVDPGLRWAAVSAARGGRESTVPCLGTPRARVVGVGALASRVPPRCLGPPEHARRSRASGRVGPPRGRVGLGAGSARHFAARRRVGRRAEVGGRGTTLSPPPRNRGKPHGRRRQGRRGGGEDLPGAFERL